MVWISNLIFVMRKYTCCSCGFNKSSLEKFLCLPPWWMEEMHFINSFTPHVLKLFFFLSLRILLLRGRFLLLSLLSSFVACCSYFSSGLRVNNIVAGSCVSTNLIPLSWACLLLHCLKVLVFKREARTCYVGLKL